MAPALRVDRDANRSAIAWGKRGELAFKVVDERQSASLPKDRIAAKISSPPLSDPHPLGLGLLLFFPRKLEDARVGLIGHFGKHQQVVAPEALRRLPFTSGVFVEPREGDVVPRLLFGSIRPYQGAS